jgi:uncharacterized protein (DUF302 family)
MCVTTTLDLARAVIAARGGIAILCLTLAVVMGLSGEPASAKPPGWQEIKTPHDYKTLVQRLDQAIKANKLFAVSRASASAGAQRRGIEIPGNMVVGVYRNDFAVRMLEASVPAGIEAPIRFYLTQNSDGTATLSYRTPSALFAPYEDGGEGLKTLARELDQIFARIADRATAP